jgi:hypothetical protein
MIPFLDYMQSTGTLSTQLSLDEGTIRSIQEYTRSDHQSAQLIRRILQGLYLDACSRSEVAPVPDFPSQEMTAYWSAYSAALRTVVTLLYDESAADYFKRVQSKSTAPKFRRSGT